MLGWLAFALVALVGLFYLLSGDAGAAAGYEGLDRWLFVGAAGVMALYAILLTWSSGNRVLDSIRHLLIWGGLMLALIAGYAYRDDVSLVVNRVAGEILPAGEPTVLRRGEDGEVAVRIRQRTDGHFTARAEVNGVPISLMVDTGASTVVLKSADARRLGIDLGELQFTLPVQTANGTAFTAPYRLREIKVGPIRIENVEALIAKPGSLNESLLGMSFLRRLRSYEFSGDYLTLRS